MKIFKAGVLILLTLIFAFNFSNTQDYQPTMFLIYGQSYIRNDDPL